MTSNGSPLGLIVRFALAGAALFFVACGSSSLPTATELTTLAGPQQNLSMGDQVGEYIVNFRQGSGRQAQIRHSGLDKLAQLHAKRMLARGEMDHDNYHHRLGMAEAYYDLGGLRENVAHGKGFSRSDMGRVMVEGWIRSKNHRQNLLAKTTHYGVGIAIGEDGSFYSAHLTASQVVNTSKNSAFRPGMPLSYSNKYGAAGGPAW